MLTVLLLKLVVALILYSCKTNRFLPFFPFLLHFWFSFVLALGPFSFFIHPLSLSLFPFYLSPFVFRRCSCFALRSIPIVVREGDWNRRWRCGEGVRSTKRRAQGGDRAEGGVVSHVPRSGGMPFWFLVVLVSGFCLFCWIWIAMRLGPDSYGTCSGRG